MTIKNILKILFLLLTLIISMALKQDKDCILLKKVVLENQFLEIDQEGNVYSINNQTLTKFNKSGEKIREYSNNYIGTISQIDASDPLRLLLFCKEFNQLVFLDGFFNTLREPIKLDDLGLQQISIVCSSASGGFWIYDYSLRKIRYFNAGLQEKYYSADVSNLINTREEPIFMREYPNYLFVLFKDIGIVVFDKFASYIKTIPATNVSNFQVSGDGNLFWYVEEQNSIVLWNLKSSQKEVFKLPEIIETEKPKNVVLIKNTIYTINEKGFLIYSLK